LGSAGEVRGAAGDGLRHVRRDRRPARGHRGPEAEAGQVLAEEAQHGWKDAGGLDIHAHGRGRKVSSVSLRRPRITRVEKAATNALTDSFAFVEYSSPAEAAAATRQLDLVPLDKKHTLRVNKMTDIERYGGEGRVD